MTGGKSLLPKEVGYIVIKKDYPGAGIKFKEEDVFICLWEPFGEDEARECVRRGEELPGETYLGTARVIMGDYFGIGFHAWNFSDREFRYWRGLTEEEMKVLNKSMTLDLFSKKVK